MKVVVASKNPVKINTTSAGFAKMFPNIKIEVSGAVDGAEVSGVSMQPMSSIETIKGAKNRVQSVKKLIPEADYWVGIEGGLEEIDNKMEAFAWVIIESKEG